MLLIGHMYQFPPVQPGFETPSLHQTAVMLGLGLNMPNEEYRAGAQLFTRFQTVKLNGQVRSLPEFDGQLRDATH